jgi:hypothetical protein
VIRYTWFSTYADLMTHLENSNMSFSDLAVKDAVPLFVQKGTGYIRFDVYIYVSEVLYGV